MDSEYIQWLEREIFCGVYSPTGLSDIQEYIKGYRKHGVKNR